MNIRVQIQTPDKLPCDLLVIPLTQGEHNGDMVKAFDATLHGALKEQIDRTKFPAKEGEVADCCDTRTSPKSSTIVTRPW